MTGPEVRVEVTETILGPVEIARQGSGKPVLVVHGMPGDHEVGLAVGRFLVEAGFEVIAPSRPGYRRTPLPAAPGVDGQADVMSAVLVELGYPSVGVLTWSGGGPTAYRLAIRHPGSVTGVVAINALSGPYAPPQRGGGRVIMETMLGNATLEALPALESVIESFEELRAAENLSDEEAKTLSQRMYEGMLREKPRIGLSELIAKDNVDRIGFENDLQCLASIDSLCLEEVQAPTLLIGSATGTAGRHNDHAAAKIPNAERIVVDDAGHSCLLVHAEAPALRARVIDHLKR